MEAAHKSQDSAACVAGVPRLPQTKKATDGLALRRKARMQDAAVTAAEVAAGISDIEESLAPSAGRTTEQTTIALREDDGRRIR